MKDLVLGLILLVISTTVLFLSSSFPDFVVRGERLPGPKFFPTILSIILICFAFYCVLVGFVKLIKKTRNSLESKSELTKFGILNVLFTVFGVLFFVPIITFFGTFLGIILLGTALMILFSIKWYQSLIYSSVLAFLVYTIFQVLFKVPLPEGTLFSFLVR
ncbi:tripartite tricarboxylate transporter TctB family protein [Thermotoga profunda]|uniref:tripartite tricarboxylate transporter TctB family protein n=1 Tax=Thermotoga profunda TaxID=1508420 RepID=UPI00059779A7|nr:tripartite tricarboxylate transporter TctB family protein [Thermotoga profunda]